MLTFSVLEWCVQVCVCVCVTYNTQCVSGNVSPGFGLDTVFDRFLNPTFAPKKSTHAVRRWLAFLHWLIDSFIHSIFGDRFLNPTFAPKSWSHAFAEAVKERHSHCIQISTWQYAYYCLFRQSGYFENETLFLLTNATNTVRLFLLILEN